MHPTRKQSAPQLMPAVSSARSTALPSGTLPFGTAAHRLLALALFAALALAVSGPAAADRGHDHHGKHYDHHRGHPVFVHNPGHHKAPKHYNKHHHKHYIQHHQPAPHHGASQGFSVNIWGVSPFNHHISTSYHYHGHERCYHRH